MLVTACITDTTCTLRKTKKKQVIGQALELLLCAKILLKISPFELMDFLDLYRKNYDSSKVVNN